MWNRENSDQGPTTEGLGILGRQMRGGGGGTGWASRDPSSMLGRSPWGGGLLERVLGVCASRAACAGCARVSQEGVSQEHVSWVCCMCICLSCVQPRLWAWVSDATSLLGADTGYPAPRGPGQWDVCLERTQHPAVGHIASPSASGHRVKTLISLNCWPSRFSKRQKEKSTQLFRNGSEGWL